MEAMTLATLLTDISSVVTAGAGWLTTVLTSVAGNPILLFSCVGLPMVGVGIGLFHRLKG
jgi:hypothetical protein